MKNILIAAVMTVVLYSTGLYSQESNITPLKLQKSFYSNPGLSKNTSRQDFFAQIKPDFNSFSSKNSDFILSNYPLLKIKRDSVEKTEISNPKEKNIWIGAGLSLLVPGAGEYYAKSYIKSAIFFAIEVASWSLYAIYQHKGNKQTNDFQNYANSNWSL